MKKMTFLICTLFSSNILFADIFDDDSGVNKSFYKAMGKSSRDRDDSRYNYTQIRNQSYTGESVNVGNKVRGNVYGTTSNYVEIENSRITSKKAQGVYRDKIYDGYNDNDVNCHNYYYRRYHKNECKRVDYSDKSRDDLIVGTKVEGNLIGKSINIVEVKNSNVKAHSGRDLVLGTTIEGTTKGRVVNDVTIKNSNLENYGRSTNIGVKANEGLQSGGKIDNSVEMKNSNIKDW